MQTILLLDVDFVVTEHLHERLASLAAAGALQEDLALRRTAVVLPAFETSPRLSLPEGHSAALQAVSRELFVAMFVGRSCMHDGRKAEACNTIDRIHPRFASINVQAASGTC